LLAALFDEARANTSNKGSTPPNAPLTIYQYTSRLILDPLLPFADRLQDHIEQTLSDERTRLVTLKLAALLHDVGKPAAETVDEMGRIRFLGHHEAGTRIAREALVRLRLSRVEVHLGETIVRHHMRPLQLAKQKRVSARAVYRFFRDTGNAGVEVLLHALADNRATYASDAEDEQWSRLVDLVSRMLGDYWEHQTERVAPAPLIGGSDLLREFDLQPGPQIGELLEAIREAQVSGEVHTREQALALVRDRLSG
jgi:putative nucleotidyltransferase with HDIG domain